MKAKAFLLTLFLSVAAVSLWAQGGQQVVIRAIALNPTVAKTQVIIYDNGKTETIEIENFMSKKEESLKSFGEILDRYYAKGYKLAGSSSNMSGTNIFFSEYILEKQ